MNTKKINSSIRNNLTLSDLGHNNFNKLLEYLNINKNLDVDKQLDDILKNTTIKRGCCLTNSSDNIVKIKIRFPLHEKFKANDYNYIFNKYKFIDYYITFNRSLCNNDYYRESEKCDNFYRLYCENILSFFKKENKNIFNQNDFVNYKNECACYGEKPDYIIGDIQSNCYKDGCNSDDKNIYVDKSSREKCATTFCIQAINYNKLDISGDMNTNTKLQNFCGGTIPINPDFEKIDIKYYIFGGVIILLLIIIILFK